MKIFNPSQVKRSYCYCDQRIYRASHLVFNILGQENECHLKNFLCINIEHSVFNKLANKQPSELFTLRSACGHFDERSCWRHTEKNKTQG